MGDDLRARRNDATMEAGVKQGIAMAASSGVNAAAKAMYRQGVSMPVVIRVLLYPQQRRAGDASQGARAGDASQGARAGDASQGADGAAPA